MRQRPPVGLHPLPSAPTPMLSPALLPPPALRGRGPCSPGKGEVNVEKRLLAQHLPLLQLDTRPPHAPSRSLRAPTLCLPLGAPRASSRGTHMRLHPVGVRCTRERELRAPLPQLVARETAMPSISRGSDLLPGKGFTWDLTPRPLFQCSLPSPFSAGALPARIPSGETGGRDFPGPH